MNADQAWQAALDQLQMEMSRAAFTTWVKEARLVEYQDGRFLVGVATPYTRDWLDSRLKSTIVRILTGMMNCPKTSVEFVVLDGQNDPQDEAAEDISGEDADGANEEPEERLVFFDAPRSLYNAIVRPERVLSLPRYLLRFLPLVGSEIFLVQWAFRQMRFLRTEQGKQHYSFEATINDLLRWTTWSSRASFRRYMDRPELKWFGIEQIPQEGRAIDPVTGLAKQKPNRYRIQIDIPLTPMDADILRVILEELRICEDPVNALAQALKMSDEILRPENPLPMPTIAHQAMPPKPIQVGDVVRGMLENIKLELATRKELTRLSDQLANKILRPTESIQATWYFFQDWMAELERADLGTFIILMRSLCFCNSDETRDSVWIEGGDWEIAERMGIKREKTISSWFPKAYTTGPRRKTLETLVEHSRKEQERALHDAACIEQFVRRDSQRPNQQGRHACHFHVRVGSDTLTAEDKILYDAALEVYVVCEKENLLDLLGGWVREAERYLEAQNSAFETLEIVKIPFLRLSENGNSAFEPLVTAKIPPLRSSEERKSAFETLGKLLNSAFETLQASKIPPLRLFKVLKDSVPLQNQVPEEATTTDENQPGTDEVVEQSFVLRKLLKLNGVHEAIISKLLCSERGQTWPFISWLIYGNSPQGHGVNNPISIAIRKLEQQPGMGAGGAFDRLARRSPKQLAYLVDRALGFSEPNDSDWRLAMDGAEKIKLRRLAGEWGIPISE